MNTKNIENPNKENEASAPDSGRPSSVQKKKRTKKNHTIWTKESDFDTIETVKEQMLKFSKHTTNDEAILRTALDYGLERMKTTWSIDNQNQKS